MSLIILRKLSMYAPLIIQHMLVVGNLSSASALAHWEIYPVLLVSKAGGRLLTSLRCDLLWHWCPQTCSEVTNVLWSGHQCLSKMVFVSNEALTWRGFCSQCYSVWWWQKLYYCWWRPVSPLRLTMAKTEDVNFTTETVLKQFVQVLPSFAIVPVTDNSGIIP